MESVEVSHKQADVMLIVYFALLLSNWGGGGGSSYSAQINVARHSEKDKLHHNQQQIFAFTEI